MKRDDVQIGKIYTAKVTDKLVPVRIDAENRHGGWNATNLATGKKVRIKSPQRLRTEVKADATKPKELAEAAKAAGAVASAEHLRGIAAADQENARLRDQRAKAADGMTNSERAMAKSAKGGKATCPNCGSAELDEDGDCAKCGEPSVAPKKGMKATTSPTSARGAEKRGKATTNTRSPKGATRAKQGDQKAKKPSGLDAAARVLAEADEPMGVKQIVEVAFAKGYWKTGGKTPHATVYSAIIREISTKGKDSRFKKVDRGRFALNG